MNSKSSTENNDDDQESVPPVKAAKKPRETDLPDNQHDEERMQPEEITIELPDVFDIPGQEHIHVPQMREMQDVTIASDDEEGVGLFGDEDEALLADDINDKMTPKQEILMGKLHNADSYDNRLKRTELDDVDDDGDALNEDVRDTSVSGKNLDTSGVNEDDALEDIGEGNEENNLYSLGGNNNNEPDENKK